jgi:hypothetical protein
MGLKGLEAALFAFRARAKVAVNERCVSTTLSPHEAKGTANQTHRLTKLIPAELKAENAAEF